MKFCLNNQYSVSNTFKVYTFVWTVFVAVHFVHRCTVDGIHNYSTSKKTDKRSITFCFCQYIAGSVRAVYCACVFCFDFFLSTFGLSRLLESKSTFFEIWFNATFCCYRCYCCIFFFLLLLCCLMSSDIGWHIRDKLRPMRAHGSILLCVHGNRKAR